MTGSISERARNGLEYFVTQAAKVSLVTQGTVCEVLPVAKSAATELEVVMFTVASYTFRVLLFVHFDNNAQSREYFASWAEKSTDEIAVERFRDAVMERGNLFCGAVNRDLSMFFPHMGMSTPCILHRSALAHLDSVKPTLTQSYRAEVSPTLALHLTLVLCTFAEFDFPFEPRAMAAAETAGELEMF